MIVGSDSYALEDFKSFRETYPVFAVLLLKNIKLMDPEFAWNMFVVSEVVKS